MGSNWISPLEFCAAGGVLDYDAAADILDMPQRFAGNPNVFDTPAVVRPLLLPPGTKIKGELKEDCYNTPSNLIQNPSWKKWVFGGLVVLGALALVFRKKLPKISELKKLDFSKMGTSVKEFGKKVLSYIKKPFKYIAGKLKK